VEILEVAVALPTLSQRTRKGGPLAS
jgi:hypothetical protein